MESTALEMSAGARSHVETEASRLDGTVAKLGDHAKEFAELGPAERAELLAACVEPLRAAAPAWVEAAVRAKGLVPDAPAVSEEWLGGPMTTMRNLRLLRRTLLSLAARGEVGLDEGRFGTAPDGRTTVEVFPSDGFDGTLNAGFTCRVRMQEGMSAAAARERAGSFYKRGAREGGVSLVLGAGNVASIPPMDAFYKMFVDGRVCLLKMNPVNEYLGPHLERALAPLVTRGYLGIVYGGAEVGARLVTHPGVADVHITGSIRTHDQIVWGPPGPERERRKAARTPLLEKPITSELGSVTPVVIAPGEYAPAELRFMAENIATMVANNGSFNCNAASVLVTSRAWPQREALLRQLREVLAGVAPRRSYYPGAGERYASLLAGREATRLGPASDECLPWALVTGLDPERADEPLFTTESFCPILRETALEPGAAAEFIPAARRFCDERLWGTLSMSLFVHPRDAKDPAVSAALERAIAELRYGAVVINHWAGVVYGSVTPPWGGHASATLEDAQGGVGFVHNTFMLEGIEKVVLRGPLTMSPKPPWFVTHRNAAAVAEKLFAFEAAPSWWKVPGIALSALRS